MLREDCNVGMRVSFGRRHGEKTTGKVIKMNPTKANVEIDAPRGVVRVSTAGAIWHVPYSMIEPANGESHPIARPATLTYSPIYRTVDRHILMAILQCYIDLSPENVSCDGELHPVQIRQRVTELRQKLRALCQAYGKDVSESDIYNWDSQRRKSEQACPSTAPA